MVDLFFDPTKFFRTANSPWGTAVAGLLVIQIAGVAALFVKMALFIPSEEVSFPVVGYIVGLGISTLVSALVNLVVAFAIFWVLTWFTRDRFPLVKLLTAFAFALIPGQVATMIVRIFVILLSPGSTPLSKITNSTSAAAFVDNPPGFLAALDPFLIWSIVLLAIGYREMTGGKRSQWFSLSICFVPLVVARIM